MTRSTKVIHKTVRVGDLDIFYREAGPNDAPAILLLLAKVKHQTRKKPYAIQRTRKKIT